MVAPESDLFIHQDIARHDFAKVQLSTSMTESQVYQLKVSLRYLKPPIWRRIQVPDYFSFEALNFAIQEVMGWQDFHMHMFRVNNVTIGKSFTDKDESVTFIQDYLKAPKQKFFYNYDMGFTWYHNVVLEKILPAKENVNYPICVSGRRKSPPEDPPEGWQDKVDPSFKFKPFDFFKNWDNSKYPKRGQVAEAGGQTSDSDSELSELE